jgi:hypothetical protein
MALSHSNQASVQPKRRALISTTPMQPRMKSAPFAFPSWSKLRPVVRPTVQRLALCDRSTRHASARSRKAAHAWQRLGEVAIQTQDRRLGSLRIYNSASAGRFRSVTPLTRGGSESRRSNGSETADRMGGGAFPESRRSASGSTNRPAVPVPSGEGLGDEEPRL